MVVRCSLSSHDTLSCPWICASIVANGLIGKRTARRCLEYLVKVAPIPCFDRETFGSPEFPGYPYEQMTRSQTPVVTLNTCLSAFRSAAFQKIQSVGFRLLSLKRDQVYPMTTTLHFSGLNTDPPFSFHLASDPRRRVCPQVSLLPCRLDFRQVGLAPFCTHPLGNINQFHPYSGNPEVPSLARHEHLPCYASILWQQL